MILNTTIVMRGLFWQRKYRWKEEIQSGGILSNLGRIWWNQGGSNEHGKSWADSQCILKVYVFLTMLMDQTLGVRGRKESRMTPTAFIYITWKGRVGFEMGRPMGYQSHISNWQQGRMSEKQNAAQSGPTYPWFLEGSQECYGQTFI